ncbi:hypothetical protein FHS07_000322 [Microbacterium proteolyticum]|uniref:Uncharacterized protein n=1 Tax=Microbacterium proteolyticum TaxID=1572644 RepID=A0A7W5GEL7_9MICO|nr:hypothetical protein [Microbacterium proteolyticum]MBB3156638.1 hypothetical protein [Microbacterium proteolyticum]
MSAEVNPVLPAGVSVVSRGPGGDPAVVDGRGLLRPQRAQDGPGLVSGAEGASIAADGRVARAAKCPECRDGKHRVCAEFADITDDDELIPCICPCREDAP